MHIVDGALTTPVLVAGGVATAAGVAMGLRSIDHDKIPQVGILGAMFFVASLVHVPIGPSSVHLVLNGLVGLVLGWAAFPALLVALVLQAVFFGFGGLTVLGVNTFNLAMPAVLCFYLFGAVLRSGGGLSVTVLGTVAGALSVALTAGFVAMALSFSGEEFVPAAKLAFISHLPVMVVEGMLTGAAVTLLRKVRPEALALAARRAV